MKKIQKDLFKKNVRHDNDIKIQYLSLKQLVKFYITFVSQYILGHLIIKIYEVYLDESYHFQQFELDHKILPKRYEP